MSETKWTSGPYKPKFIRGEGTSWWVVTDLAGYEIAEVSYTAGSAEAHLFAAAPELYEALEIITKLERGDLVGREFKKAMSLALRQADAALAKARGEQ